MPDRPPRTRPDATAAFIEHLASFLSEAGFARMPARVFAGLLVTDAGRLTAAELAQLLRISPAAVSTAVRYLCQLNLVSREREPGSRRDRYCVREDVWYEALAGRDQLLTRGERCLREGIALLGRDTRAGARMLGTLGFFEFMQTELPLMLRRWRARNGAAASLNNRPASGALAAAGSVRRAGAR